jgi:hypothetical protein
MPGKVAEPAGLGVRISIDKANGSCFQSAGLLDVVLGDDDVAHVADRSWRPPRRFECQLSRQLAVHQLIRHAGEAPEPATQHHAKLACQERLAAVAQYVHSGGVARAPSRALEMAANNGVASAIHGIAWSNRRETRSQRIDSARSRFTCGHESRLCLVCRSKTIAKGVQAHKSGNEQKSRRWAPATCDDKD